MDPLVVRYLHERQENQYSLMMSVLVSVINDQLEDEYEAVRISQINVYRGRELSPVRK